MNVINFFPNAVLVCQAGTWGYTDNWRGPVLQWTHHVPDKYEISQFFTGQNPDKYSRNIHGYHASPPLKLEWKIIGI